MIPRSTPALRLAAPALALLLLAGCQHIPKSDPAKTGPYFTPANVRAPARLPIDLRRFAIMPVSTDGPLIAEADLLPLDTALRSAFTQANRAELTPVDRDTLARLTGHRQLTATAVLPPRLLERIAALTGADAVLFVDVTSYTAYPPLNLGLRARLIDIKTGEIWWAFDNVFTATNPLVVNSARHHFLKDTLPGGARTDLTVTVLQNPARFAEYVFTATAATLPAR